MQSKFAERCYEEKMDIKNQNNSPYNGGVNNVYNNVYNKHVNKTNKNKKSGREQYAQLKKLLNTSDDDFDYITKWIEDIALFVGLISNADTIASRSLAVATLVKLRFGDSPIVSIDGIELVLDFIDYMMADIELPMKEQSLNSFTHGIDSVRHVFDNYTALKEKAIFKKSYKVIGYLMSLCLCKENKVPFNNKIFLMFANEFTYKEWGEDFITSIVDLLLFVTERGLACFKAGSLEPIMHEATAYEEWYMAAKRHISNAEYLNNPEAHNIIINTYLNELENLIEQGKCIKKYVSKIDSRSVNHIILSLEKILKDQIGYNAALADRPSPDAMMINGGTSVAKSSFVHVMFVFYGLLFNLPIEPEYKYVRNAADKYWTNFRTYKWFYVSDDAGFMHPDIAGEGDQSVMEGIQIINNVSFLPTQASLDDKGKTPCRVRLAIFTTNTVHLNAHNYFSCPLAVLRRFPIVIDLQPKKEYRKEGAESQFIDGSKLPEVKEGEFPNFWHIRVFKPVPASPEPENFESDNILGTSADYRLHQRAKFELVRKFDDIYEFLSWYGVQAKLHHDIQSKYMDFTKNLKVNKLCLTCYSVVGHCRCCTICKNNKYTSDCNCHMHVQSQEKSESTQIPRTIPLVYRPEVVEETLRQIYDIGNRTEEKTNMFYNIVNYPFIWLAQFILYICNHFPMLGYLFGPFFIELAANILMGARSKKLRHMGYTILTDVVKRKLGMTPRTILLVKCLTGILACSGMTYIIYKIFMTLLPNKITPAEEKTTIDRKELNIDEINKVCCFCDKCNFNKTAVIYDHYNNPQPLCNCRICHFVEKQQKWNNDEQGIKLSEIGIKPKPHAFERPEAWPRRSFNLSPYELNPITTSWKRFTMNQVTDMIKPNLKRYKTYKDKNDTEFDTSRAMMFGLCGHVYVCNTHSIPEPPFYMEIWDNIDTSLSLNKKIQITSNQIRRLKQDITLLFIYNLPPVKNISGLIPKCILPDVFNGFYIVLNHQCEVEINEIKAITHTIVESPKGPTNVYLGYPQKPTKEGDCGALLFTMSGLGPILLGFHYLGESAHTFSINKTKCGAQTLEYNYIMSGVNSFDMVVVNTGQIELGKPGYPVEQAEIHHKSPVHYLENGVVKIITGHNIPRPKYTTNIVPSMWQEKLLRDGWTCKYIPPTKMNTWNPWYIGLKARVTTNQYFDYDTVELAAKSFFNDIMTSLPQDALNDIHTFDIDTAINGIAGMAHVNSIDWTTSMGFPYRKNKKYFREDISTNEEVKFTLNDEMLGEIEKILNLYENKTLYHPIFSASLKDEVISQTKDDEGKIRIFMGAYGPWVIVVRMVYLWSCRLMQSNPYIFETAAGMQCHSDEWEIMFQYLTEHGTEKIIAGDYAGYDTNDDTLSIIFAFKILIWIAREAKVPDSMLNMMECIMEDTTYNVVEYWGVIIQLIGCLPSGFPLTLLINCLKNSIYMRCAYIKLSPNNDCTDFKKHIKLMTMGDDNICGVSDEAQFFNHTSISLVFSNVGIKYTMDDKEAESIPYISIYDASFVKRKWYFNEDLGVHCCPIAEESIKKSLFWRMQSKHVAPEKHACIVIGDALREYSYYGQTIFEKKKQYFESAVREAGYGMYLEKNTFMSYQEHLNRWYEHSKIINYESYPWMDSKRKVEIMSRINFINYEETKMVGPIVNNKETNNHSIMVVQNEHFHYQSDNNIEMKASEALEEDIEGDQEGVIEFFENDIYPIITPGLKMRDVWDRSDETASLANWFSRPLLIDSYTWQIADTLGVNHLIYPWTLFFTNSVNASKLNNYSFLRCKLRLKVTVNGTPFLYGAYMLSYRPMAASLTSNITFGPTIEQGSANQSLVQLSQLPHMWIYPHENKGGEMELPFLYHKNWLSLTGATNEFDTMGFLRYTLVTPLQSANGASSSGITINTFCWAEDVELSGPTTTLSFQSMRGKQKKKKDEYQMEGQVSGPASAVASLASWFTKAPIIGPFATATEMGARAIASGAAALGYTNVPVISDVKGLRPMVTSGFSNSEIGFQLEKLTMDPKNELTIDNTAIGGPSHDELNISDIVTRESYLGQFVWAQTATESTGLFSSVIAPDNYCVVDSTTYSSASNSYAFYSVPMTYVSQLFEYWRGDIILRFKVICSKYHKGRLRIAWEPAGHGSTTLANTDGTNAVYSEVFDIGVDTDIEVRIPYMQPTEWSFLRYMQGQFNTFGSIGAYNSMPSRDNGFLVVRVLNELSAPSTSATATILVFARGADNLEFAGPATTFENDYGDQVKYSLFQPQSENRVEKKSAVFGKISKPKPERFLTNHGEGIVTLRQYLRRTSYVGSDTSFFDNTAATLFAKVQSRIPCSYGYDPTGYGAANSLITGITVKPFNWDNLHPLPYVMSMFLGFRGSTNWFFAVVDSADAATSDFKVGRYVNRVADSPPTGVTVYTVPIGTVPNAVAAMLKLHSITGQAGMSMTDTRTQPILAIQAPNYSRFLFQGTNKSNASSPPYGDDQNMDMLKITWSGQAMDKPAGTYQTRLDSYCSIGTDFNVIFFMCTPVLYGYGITPIPFH
nr:MAG: polyprotein [Picornavirales sp.]